jgi:hypothetical protein
MAVEKLEEAVEHFPAFTAAFRRNTENRVPLTNYGAPDCLGGGTTISQGKLPCGLLCFIVKK